MRMAAGGPVCYWGGWLCHTSTGLGYSCSGSRVEAAEYPGVHGESLQSVEEEEEELLFY